MGNEGKIKTEMKRQKGIKEGPQARPSQLTQRVKGTEFEHH